MFFYYILFISEDSCYNKSEYEVIKVNSISLCAKNLLYDLALSLNKEPATI